jgi:biopolymer transport protein ExbB
METQRGLLHFWTQGDAITQGAAVLLLGMSILSWAVIVTKAWLIVRLQRMARQVAPFWQVATLDQGLNTLTPEPDNPFHLLAKQGQAASAHHRATQALRPDGLDLSDWVTRCLRHALDEASTRMQSGLAVLASVGATAPFVGLLGTVWGIYHALMGIGASGQVNLSDLAGPIGEALTMTALGLVVAVPAVLGYNTLLRGNKFIVGQLQRFANDLHAHLVTGARVGQATQREV